MKRVLVIEADDQGHFCLSVTRGALTVGASPAHAEVVASDCRGGERCVRGVRHTVRYDATSPAVPLPHEPRVARERVRRRQLLGAELPPQPARAAERWHTALSRDPRPRTLSQGLPATRSRETVTGLDRKAGVMVPGPGGMVLIKAGQQMDEELQQQLDDRCEIRPQPSTA